MDFDRDELWEATREDRLRRWRSYPEGLHEPEAKKVFQDDSPTEADAFLASPKKRRMRRRRFFEEDDDAAAEASDDAASSSDASDDDSLSSPSSSRSSEWITSDGGTRFRWEYATPPLEDGVAMGAEWEWESGSDFDDADAESTLLPILQEAAERFQPHAIVCCAGAGVIAGDRLGCLNMTLESHTAILKELMALERPMLVLGSAGYAQLNAALTWCNATAALCGVELPEAIPAHLFREDYLPEYKLEIQRTVMHNKNTAESLDATRRRRC